MQIEVRSKKLKKGRGIPVTGPNPIVINKLIIIWNKKVEAIPITIRDSKLVLAIVAVLISFLIKKKNKNKTIMHPTKPNSSPKALNIKSVCCSGINCKLVSLPCSKPVPNNPPEPIAI